MTIDALLSAAALAPRMVLILLAGCAAACLGGLLLGATRRLSFATRAAALQACVLVLLTLSALEMLPRRWVGQSSSVPTAVRGALVALPALAEPMQRFAEWAHPAVPTPSIARTAVALLVLGWMLGTGLMLFRLARGAMAVKGIRRRARAHPTRAVLVSDEVDIPFVHGLRAPAIIVPAASDAWTLDDWAAVLHHETSHITRGDVVAQWARQLVLALHWCNPAVHWLARQAEAACEGACDDAVLLRGTPVESYAETLLSFADASWRVPAAPAPTMARRNGLERRVLAMLHDERPRQVPRRRDRVTPRLIGICCGAIIAIALPAPAAIAARIEMTAPIQTVRPTSTSRQPRSTAPRSPDAPARAVANDTTEALLGLAALLEDRNPIVRSSATDALLRWGGLVAAHLTPIAQRADGDRQRYARAALAVMETPR
jgi:beta-lactamase regulating signal transducer with metallopeptidase domain